MGIFLPTALKDCQKIGLVGLGTSNLGVLSYLEECKENISLSIRAEKTAAHPRYAVRCGDGYLDDITEDALILSPSVRPDREEIRAARARGARILSDSEIFFRDTAAKCFAVTGSDGKSTTTALLSHLLSAAMGEEIPAAGNIGRAMTPLLALSHKAYAIELSSFQLFHYTPRCERAVITNLTENHLNWHKDMREYAQAKASLYENAKEAILPLDEPMLASLLRKPPFAVYSLEASEKALAKKGADFAYCIKDGCVFENGRRLLPLSLFPLSGKHNLKNLLCALSMAAGYVTKDSAEEIRSFRPLAHRCERIAMLRGAEYFDSSIDSSPSRTRETLSAFSSPVILLLGGLGKGCSLSPLMPCVSEKCRAVIGFGPLGREATEFLRAEGYGGILPPPAKGLADAVALAKSLAAKGDSVLLSPGGTSFDEFENFSARGECFRRLVLETEG